MRQARTGLALLAATLAFAAPIGLSAQAADEGMAVGVSVGSYTFLSGSAVGLALHAAKQLSGASPAVALWFALPSQTAIGVDAGILAGTRGNPGFFVRAGPGLFIARDLVGPGIHTGAGLLVKGGSVAFRLEGTMRWYSPEGGVPAGSIELGLMQVLGK